MQDVQLGLGVDTVYIIIIEYDFIHIHLNKSGLVRHVRHFDTFEFL